MIEAATSSSARYYHIDEATAPRPLPNNPGAAGKSASLRAEDLYEVPERARCERVYTRFLPLWRDELRTGRKSLSRALLRLCWRRWLLAYVLAVASQLLQLVGPFLIRALVEFFGTAPPERGGDGKPYWWGLLYAALIFLAPFVSSFTNNVGHIVTNEISLWIRHCLQLLVYEKALRMGTADIVDQGKCVNLLSTDTQIFMDTLMMINSALSAPILMIACAVMLYQAIGWVGLVSVGLTTMVLPLNIIITRQIARNTRKVQAQTDRRVRLMNELVHGIRIVKYYVWERPFISRVEKAREDELHVQLQNGALRTGNLTLHASTPPAVLFFTFALQSLLGAALTPASVFTTFAVLNTMRQPFNLIGYFANYYSQWKVSLQRIREFLLSGELTTHKPRVGFGGFSALQPPPPSKSPDFAATLYSFTEPRSSSDESKKTLVANSDRSLEMRPVASVSPVPSPSKAMLEPGVAISMAGASFTWADGETALADADLKIRQGELVMVIGTVGSGKTALVMSLLGELFRVAGTCRISGPVAYVPQVPWILNQTLRDNILFGSPYEEDRYKEVLRVCALDVDIQTLPGGDLCEIGERGITLSGGQKQRVSLARAIYCNCDVVLLDDTLSALDMHVGRHVMEECIFGVLKDKTRLLVTNGLHNLDQADRVVVLENQEIRFNGTYEELLQAHLDLSKFITQPGAKKEDGASPRSPRVSPVRRSREARRSTSIRGPMSARRHGAGGGGGGDGNGNGDGAQLVKKEEQEQGNVSFSIYKQYFLFGGLFYLVTLLFGYANRFTSRVLFSFYLSRWSTAITPASSSSSWSSSSSPISLSSEQDIVDSGPYMTIQGILVLYEIVAISGTSLTWLGNGKRASRRLHSSLLGAICGAPTTFFDKTPLGRLVSRFSKDIRTVDQRLPNHMEMWMGAMTNMFSVLTVVCLADWWTIIPIVPIAGLYWYMQRAYRRAVIEVRRLEGTSRSPIYIHFDNTLSGLVCIRAYRCARRFRTEFASKLDENGRITYSLFLCQQWFSQRLEWIGAVTQSVVILSLLAGRYLSSSDIGLIALAIGNMSSISQSLSAWSKNAAAAEQTMQSVERILQYCDLPKEEPVPATKDDAPEGWPTAGNISFNNLSVRYRPELPLVLKGIHCEIKHGEKIGVVGRTGSGKSTLLLALLRVLEPASGSISIDGVDTSGLLLEALRSKLTIIPQDPTLFSGTMRYNVDPFAQFTDDEIWHALDLAHLKDHVASMDGGLSALVAENGDNFSVGQKQLICMARAILRRSKIILMDEATASIDVKTDMQIQSMIRTVFADCTVLTVAHRLLTIMDSSRVMVLQDGALAEFDSPLTLLREHSETSVFASLVRDSNDGLLIRLAAHEVSLEQCLLASCSPTPSASSSRSVSPAHFDASGPDFSPASSSHQKTKDGVSAQGCSSSSSPSPSNQ